MDIISYILSKKYTDKSLVGSGALKGANCTIQSIEPISGGHRITFKWVLNDDTVETDTMDVMDGNDGLGIKSIDINSNNHLIVTYDDNTTHDAGLIKGEDGSTVTYTQTLQRGIKIGEITIDGTKTNILAPSGGSGGSSALSELADVDLSTLSDGDVLVYDNTNSKWVNESPEEGALVTAVLSKDTMPTASLEYEDIVVLYIGTTSVTYTKGHSYLCVENSGSYSWTDITPSGSGSTVVVTPILESGTKIAEIDVDGTTTNLFAPEGGGGTTLVTQFEVTTSGWTADSTTQSGATLYKKSIALTQVDSTFGVVAIGSTGALPTVAQQAAYDLLQYVTIDSTVPCLYLYASDIPTDNFYIKVEGVTSAITNYLTVKQGAINYQNGQVTESTTSVYAEEYIPVNAGAFHILNAADNSINCVMRAYDSNDGFVGAVSTIQTVGIYFVSGNNQGVGISNDIVLTRTSGATASKIRIEFRYADSSPITPSALAGRPVTIDGTQYVLTEGT